VPYWHAKINLFVIIISFLGESLNMFDKYWKPLLLMVVIILLSSIGARILGGQETLSDYAEKNPDIAYGNSSSSISDSSTYISSVSSSIDSTSDNKSLSDTSNISNDSNTSDDSTDEASDSSSYASSESDDLGKEISTETDIVTYKDGFYYESIQDDIKARIWNISYPDGCTVELSSLRYCNVKYIDFNGNEQIGELICNKSIADDLMEIFYELYINDYRIESIKLIDEFNGDDTASMEANNTSCFNYRVVEGTTTLSKHALGLAIDLNPFYNPYITYNSDGSTNCSPADSRQYEDRTQNFPYKIDENDLAYKLFISHGFTWGGNWNSCKDYQHFQKAE